MQDIQQQESHPLGGFLLQQSVKKYLARRLDLYYSSIIEARQPPKPQEIVMAATTKYESRQEVIDAIKAMREYPSWSEKTSYTTTAEEVVDDADRVCTEQAPAGWSWNMVAKVAKYMIQKNENAARAFLLY
jgi:hypothetical protein